MPTKKGSAAKEEAQASASVRDQIAYEQSRTRNIPGGPLSASAGDGETAEPKTLFERTQDAQRVYWELLSDLEDSLDVEIDGTSDLQSMTLDELKSRRGKSQCNGKGCETMVGPRDPYYATPCGSYCSDCMETEHAPGCEICASEFDLEPESEDQPKDAQAEARSELEGLLPGVIERKSLATGTNAIFGPDGQCLAFNWVDALRVSKEKQQ